MKRLQKKVRLRKKERKNNNKDLWCVFKVFLNTHLGYSVNFTFVYLWQIKGGIPPPSGGLYSMLI